VKSLKEWATVVKALESGVQTIILRKGGILETASGFKIESKKFLLFPTWEHQELHHLKPQYHKYLQYVKTDKPSKDFNKITSYAEVLAEYDISDMTKIQALSDFHIWSDSYIEQRMNWMPEKPLKAIFLRVYHTPNTITIPMIPQYQGCKSWIDINDKISISDYDNNNNHKPVLSDSELNETLSKFKEIIN
jgi:hypothetical protein